MPSFALIIRIVQKIFQTLISIVILFGYDFGLSEETLQQIAGGAIGVAGAINAVMHVVTSKKVGVSSNG
jgi:hypothetical protein